MKTYYWNLFANRSYKPLPRRSAVADHRVMLRPVVPALWVGTAGRFFTY